jgi:hypothetical protein
VLSHPTLIRSSLIWLFHPVLFKNQTLLIRTYVIVPRMPTMLVVQIRIASIGIWWQNALIFARLETSASIRGFRGDSIQLSKSYELRLGDGDCMYFNLSKKVRSFTRYELPSAQHNFSLNNESRILTISFSNFMFYLLFFLSNYSDWIEIAWKCGCFSWDVLD